MRKLTFTLLIAIWVLMLEPHPLLAETSSKNTHPDPQPSVKRPPGRSVVSILWFENKAGSHTEHWRHGLEGSLRSIRQVKAIRLRGGVGYARRKLGIEEGSALNANQAREIGELVEAQRVIWGSYQRRDDKWQVSVNLLNVATGEVSDPLSAASTDWYDIRDELTEQILAQLKIVPSEEDEKKLIHRETTSSHAFEWYVKAFALLAERRPLSELEECERKAIAADPVYAEAYAGLVSVLGSQGEFEQAEEMVRRALEIRPDCAQAHLVLGITLVHQKKYAEAEIEIHKALRLEPDDAGALSRLAQLYLAQGKLDEAIVYDEKAIILEPMDATIHAQLGLAYAHKRDRDKAMPELKEAERLADPEGISCMDAEKMLCQASELLGEIPLAVEHYEKFVALARKTGTNPRGVSWFGETAQRLKATLAPTFIEAKMPEVHTEQTLQSALQARLTRAELEMVVNPVAGSPEIKRWARQLTEGAGSDFDKAKAIFDGLTQRNKLPRRKRTGYPFEEDSFSYRRKRRGIQPKEIQPEGGFGKRTALEVFAAWNDPNESFSCQEYAKLYLALARNVDVKAFYVHLGRDYRGRLIFHDCAIVFVGGKALLVDPAYRWFGVPHKEFVVLDDVQTVAHHFFQHTPGGRAVSRCRLATKLHPDFAWGQLCLAAALWAADEHEQAHKALDAADQLEPGRWDACRLRGQMAIDNEDWDTAIAHLRNALELNPEDAESYFFLGDALAGKGKQEEAREEYRASLTHSPRDATADKARRAIVQINEKIGSESAQEYKTAALMVASEAGHTETVRRMLAEGTDVNIQESSGATALMGASRHGHIETVRLLVEEGANVNAETIDGQTALMGATHGGHTEAVRLLLEMEADVGASTANGETALMFASQNGRTDVVRVLLERDAKVNAKSTEGFTALMVACENDHLETVGHLLECGAEVNAKSEDGATALMLASDNGYVGTAGLLLEHGAEVNAKSKNGLTALMGAARGGHTEAVRLLLEMEADVSASTANGEAALMLASQNGRTDVVRVLLERDAKVNVKNTEGLTALMVACENDHLETVGHLLECGAEVNAKSEDGVTALMWASQNGYTEIVQLLVEKGANVNGKNNDGVTALMIASGMSHKETAGLLIQKGADMDAEAIAGVTALKWASQNGHTEIVQLLIEKGADVLGDVRGNTALSIARSQGHTEIVELLTKASQSYLSTWLSEGMPVPHSEVLEYYEMVRAERFTTNAKLQFRLIDIRPSNLKPSQINLSLEETRQEAALRIATQLSERAGKGEDFGKLAKTYSHGHRRPYGGLWSPLPPGSLASPYDVLGEHARNMQAGQVSKPIQKDGHVFVLKLEQRVQKSVQLFDEVKDTLEEELRILKRRKLEESNLRLQQGS